MRRLPDLRPALAIVLCQAVLLEGCPPASSPDAGTLEAGVVVVDATCKFIEAVTNDGTVKSVCATIEEITQIAKTIFGARGDAGVRGAVGPCKQITSDLCATPEELSRGIDEILVTRRARFLRDGGSK